jgi:hypothetical protein
MSNTRKLFKEESRITSWLMPVSLRQKGMEVQAAYGDVSLSQVWRKALTIGLDRLLRDAETMKRDTEPR